MVAQAKWLSNARYHAHPAVGKSMLSVLLDSPRKYYERFVARTAPAWESTADQDFGTVAHAALLEPDTLPDVYQEIPTWALSKQGRRGGPIFEEYKAEHPGQILLHPRDVRRLEAMLTAVRQQIGAWLARPGYKELSLFWVDAATGLSLKCRPDKLWLPKRPVIADLKFTHAASSERWSWVYHRFHYWLQLAHYVAGVEAWTGREPLFRFLAVQNRPPFAVRQYMLSGAQVAAARRKHRQILERLQAYHASGVWPEHFSWDSEEVAA